MKECGFIDFDPWCGIKIGDNIENLLGENKLELDKLEIPEALENKLITALNDKIKQQNITKINIPSFLIISPPFKLIK